MNSQFKLIEEPRKKNIYLVQNYVLDIEIEEEKEDQPSDSNSSSVNSHQSQSGLSKVSEVREFASKQSSMAQSSLK